MIQNVLEFGAVRVSDPQSSHDAAATAPVRGQKATILGMLYQLDRDYPQITVNADQLHDRYPQSDRGTWSTRLSAMNRDGLLRLAGYVTSTRNGRPRKVSAYSLTEAGRSAAARLAHPSTVTR